MSSRFMNSGLAESDRTREALRFAGMQLIRLIGEEKDWNGSYQVEDGQVCVRSAYGCDSAPIAKNQDPEPIALQLLEKQVKRWAPAARRETFRPGSPFSTRRR